MQSVITTDLTPCIFVSGREVVKRELRQQSQGFGVDTLSSGPYSKTTMLGSTLSAGVSLTAQSGGSLLELLEPIAAELPRVEVALANQVNGFDPRLAEQIHYILGGAGKRLRPS